MALKPSTATLCECVGDSRCSAAPVWRGEHSNSMLPSRRCSGCSDCSPNQICIGWITGYVVARIGCVRLRRAVLRAEAFAHRQYQLVDPRASTGAVMTDKGPDYQIRLRNE